MGAGMVLWWEHSPLTNVTRGSIPGFGVVMWFEFVVGSLLRSESCFSRYSGFLLS